MQVQHSNLQGFYLQATDEIAANETVIDIPASFVFNPYEDFFLKDRIVEFLRTSSVKKDFTYHLLAFRFALELMFDRETFEAAYPEAKNYKFWKERSEDHALLFEEVPAKVYDADAWTGDAWLEMASECLVQDIYPDDARYFHRAKLILDFYNSTLFNENTDFWNSTTGPFR